MTIPEFGLTLPVGLLRGGTTGQVLAKSSDTDYDVQWSAGGGGSGTVTDVSVVTANGVSGSVATSTTTPAITLALGDITPSSVNTSGNVTAGSLTVNGVGIAAGVPTGGTQYQVLQKNSATNYDVGWTAADFIPNKTVANFAALPAAASSAGQLAICLASQGVWLINYKAAGIYYSDGVTWTYEGDYTLTNDASQIINTPAGNISATTVQGAINELDTEKVNTTDATVTATANKLMLRDADANSSINNIQQGYTATATSGGTLTLTKASTHFQRFTGTNTHTLQLPDATTLALGWDFRIVNASSGAVTINKGDGTLLWTMAGLTSIDLTCQNIATSGGGWNRNYTGIIVDTAKAVTVNNTMTMTATDGASVAFVGGGTVLYNGGALGTPSSGVLTNCTGTASGLTAGTVTTNANLTGQVTSVGNAATLDKTAISGQGTVAVAAADTILFGDTSNANALAKCTAQDIANLAAAGGLTLGQAIGISSQYLALN
jgi:hypothetical protein